MPEDAAPALFTVGYGNRAAPDLFGVLRRHGVRRLVDVRSKPYSKFNPDFTRDRLARLAADAGLEYLYHGDTLGGMPADGGSHADVAARPGFKDTLRRLASESTRVPTALMCAELRPEDCHRFRLLGGFLAGHGVEVRHLDEAGGLLSQEQVRARLSGGNRRLDVGLPANPYDAPPRRRSQP